jgi:hypothetical protein
MELLFPSSAKLLQNSEYLRFHKESARVFRSDIILQKTLLCAFVKTLEYFHFKIEIDAQQNTIIITLLSEMEDATLARHKLILINYKNNFIQMTQCLNIAGFQSISIILKKFLLEFITDPLPYYTKKQFEQSVSPIDIDKLPSAPTFLPTSFEKNDEFDEISTFNEFVMHFPEKISQIYDLAKVLNK